MIDISTETLIPIRDVPRRLPPRPTGKRVHISAVYRWIARGVHGISLDSIKVGGSTYTSVEALQRFADELNGTNHGQYPSPKITVTRRRQIERAEHEVAVLLGDNRQSRRAKHHERKQLRPA